MSYALVEDILASWEQYTAFAQALGSAPAGLVLHVAGPTDEGFRIIEVWESEDAWRRFAADRLAASDRLEQALGLGAIVRDFHPRHLVVGSQRLLARFASTVESDVASATQWERPT